MSTLQKLLVLSSLLFIVGCGPKGPRPDAVIGPFDVYFLEGFDESERKTCLKYIERNADGFYENYGSSRWMELTVGEGNTIKCSSGKDVAGCAYGSSGIIRVAAGEHYNLPALFHEMCHVNFAPTDYNHEDSRWPEWDSLGVKYSQPDT